MASLKSRDLSEAIQLVETSSFAHFKLGDT